MVVRVPPGKYIKNLKSKLHFQLPLVLETTVDDIFLNTLMNHYLTKHFEMYFLLIMDYFVASYRDAKGRLQRA